MTGKTRTEVDQYDVGTDPVVVAKLSPSRRSLLIVNDGQTDLKITTRPAQGTGRGIELLPGGSFSLTESWDFSMTQDEYLAAGSAAGGSVTVWEVVKVMEADEA